VTRRGSLRLAAGLLTTAVVLTGCASKHPANETLPKTTSAAPSTPELPPLGPKDLPMPAEARTKDAAGAEAFVRYYIALINRTSKVMDAKPLRDFSQNCRDCNRIAADTEKDNSAGYHYEGGELGITWIQAFKPGPTIEVSFRTDQEAMRVLDRSGKSVPGLAFKAYKNLSSGAIVSWQSQRTSWVMTELTLG
jgi:Family of unknown function (DUF6318)